MSIKSYVIKKLNNLLKKLNVFNCIINNQNIIIKNQNILVNYNLFRGTIQNSIWLKDKSFTAGSSAMDNAALFTLYKIFINVKPKNVIEFGLGQSSKMLHQYSAYYTDSRAITIEHDKTWYDFIINEFSFITPPPLHTHEISDKNNFVLLLELKKFMYKEFETLSYNDLGKIIYNKKYDFIIVDGPFGSEHFSRSHIIDMVPQCLSKTFCIFMDDSERIGEQETITEVCNILEKSNINYLSVTYTGEKNQHTLICSEDLKFLTTLR